MIIELVLTAIALAALVFLSTIESAYESLSEVSLRVMVSDYEESPQVGFFREILEHRQRFEMILIFGTQLSIVSIAILLFDMNVRAEIGHPVLFAFLVSLGVVILFRQLIPRIFAQNRPEAVLWRLLPAFRRIYRLLAIFVSPISNMLHRMRRAKPDEQSAEAEAEEALEEIQAFIDVAEEEGIIEESDGEMIQSIVEFKDTRVQEVMVPRPHIVAIDSSATIGDGRRLIIEKKYSRLPVYHEHLDNIDGIVHVRDLLVLAEGKGMDLPITRCMRPAYFVPETKPIADLLKEMQKAKVQIAMIIDEFGGVSGLVTIEDIVEEIVGEIEDEDRSLPREDIVKGDDGWYLVDGTVEIKAIEIAFDKEIAADDFTTVAGLVINELGHVPEAGEKLQFKGLEFEVLETDSRRVNRVRVRGVENPNDTASVE